MCKVRYLLACVILLVYLGNLAVTGEVILQCDAGEGVLQAGWTQVSSGLNSSVAGTGIDVTLATGNPSAIGARDTGGSDSLADVETDFYFADNEDSSPGSDFILTLGDLTPGVGYRLLSYHNRSNEGTTVIPSVTVTGAAVISKPDTIVQDHSIMEFPAEIIFVAGSDDVIIRYLGPDGGCAGCQAFFNGFQLEYGSAAVSFTAESSGGVESISPALITVNLSNAEVGQAYTVDYRVIGGTAIGGGTDYDLAEPDTLIFNPGQTSKNISIDIVNDGGGEPDETIILELFNPTGPNSVVGISQHTYTISDGAPTISFSSASSSGPENVTPATIEVQLSHATDEAVTVDYTTSGGTATGGGDDYTLLGTGTLTFNPLVTIQYISLDIVDDGDIEPDETVILTLSNPGNGGLGSVTDHTYTIGDNEEGVVWDGLTWFYSHDPDNLFINSEGDLEWAPEKGGQYVTRIPDQPLSQVGDKVEMVYWYLSDGKDDCPPDSCYNCIYCDDDITCIAGTSDFRFGLFQADGEYVTADGFDTSSSIFQGYKGYAFRFGPHLQAYPTRWEQCGTNEVHKTGNFQKKPQSRSDLMSINDGLKDYIPGFELPPGEWSLLTISLERLSSSSVKTSITLNDTTYTWTDTSSSEQPSMIDVFGVHMRNGRPYTRLVLGKVCTGVGEIDFNGNDVVDEGDLRVVTLDWLLTGGSASPPDANHLVLYYGFDGTLGGSVPSGLVDDTGTYIASIIAGSDPDSTIEYAEPNPTYNPGGTSAEFYNDNWSDNAGDTFLIPNSGGINFSSFTEFTVELFVNPSSAGASQTRRLFSEHIYAYMYLDSGNTLHAIRKWGGGSWNENWTHLTKANLPNGSWSYLAMTWDSDATGDKFKLYVDGELVAGAPGTSTPTIDSSAGFAIGGYQREDSSRAQFFCGRIDEFGLYDYALSQAEIAYIANEGQIPPESPANLYLDGIIDFKDFAEFALRWRDTCD